MGFVNILPVQFGNFSVWYAVCQVIGLTVLVMMLCWCVVYRGGMGWRWSPLEINVHPFMMTLGFIYIMANTLMIYRGFNQLSKMRLKQMHAALHILSLVSIIIGLTAMWDYKNTHYWPNLTSLHSWIGLITVILFVLQWAFSFLVFLYPGAQLHIRTHFMNPHVFMGLTIFMLANVAAITGLFQQTGTPTKYENSEVYGNILGLFICLFSGIVVFIVTKPGFKRLDYHI